MKRASDVIVLRIGYSFLCWIIGISAYIGAVIFFIKFNNLFGRLQGIYGFYLLMGIPIAISVAVILFFLRPIYVISCCDIFSNYISEEKINIKTPETSSTTNVLVAFIVLILIVLLMFFLREQIGIMSVIRSLL